MGFYELGNGCDSCATIPTSTPYNNVANNQNNVVQQNQVANTNALLASINATAQPSINSQMNNHQQAVQQANQQIQHYQPPAQTTTPQTTESEKKVVQAMNNKMVGTTSQNGPMLSLNIPSSLFLINLSLIVLAALAVNECFRYFINKSIQLDDGNPLYFVGYAGLAVLIAVCFYVYSRKNQNEQ